MPLSGGGEFDALRESSEEKGSVDLEELALALVDDRPRESVVDAHSEVLPAGKHLHSVRKAVVHLNQVVSC